MPEVAITAAGVISAAGRGVGPIFEAMGNGATLIGGAVAKRRQTATGSPWPVAVLDPAEVPWPTGHPWVDNKKYANLAGCAAVAVTQLVVDEAATATADPMRSGTIMAIGTSGGDELGEVISRLAVKAQTDPRPLATLLYDEVPDYSYLRGIPSQVGQFVAMATGFRGSNVAVYGEGGASGLGALTLGLRLIRAGELDRVLVVGVAPPMSASALAALDREDPNGTEAVVGRGPFDLGRAGTFAGEGAAAIMLERVDVARSRGVSTRTRLLDCETYSAPSRRQALDAAVRAVLTGPDRRPDLWFAHGAGSATLDLKECQVVAPLISAPTTSSKGTVGNLFECGGLVDVALATGCLSRGWIPPVGLLEKPDPALGEVDLVVGVPRSAPRARRALVTTFTCGATAGTAGAAVVGRGES